MFRGAGIMQRQMTDTLQIGTASGDTWASPAIETWTYDIVNTVRGFVRAKQSEEVPVAEGASTTIMTAGSNATITDATIYLPTGTTITGMQRLKLTHRDRVALGTAEIYAVVGAPQELRAALVLNALRIVGESAT